MVKKRAENIGQHCGDIRNDFELWFRIHSGAGRTHSDVQ